MKKLFSIFIVLFCILGLTSPVSAELQVGDKVNINGMEATIVGFQNGNPVYQSIIYSNIYSSSSDCLIWKSDAIYNTARISVNGTVNNGYSVIVPWNGYNGIEYDVFRAFLYFNTLPLSGYTITAGSINIYVWNKSDIDGESIQVQSGVPMSTYPHDPPLIGDYDLTNYTGDGGSKDITTFTDSVYNSITLNATGYGWVNTSGWTKFCLRTTGDINNIAPTGNNYVSFATYEQGAGYRPYLVVTYTATAPVIISVAASNVATNSARLNSTITDGGGDPTCQIEFGYGTVSRTAVNYNLYTTHTTVTVPKSDYEEGENPYLDVSGLVAGTPYFYRVKITNEFGSMVSVDEQTFPTIGSVSDMVQFVGTPEDDNIGLNWIKATGATNTIINYALDTCPLTTADGTEIYNGTGIYLVHSGLDEGTTYYYSAWGESGGVPSANPINLIMTTTSGVSTTDLPALTIPTGWFQDPDESFLVHLQPFYSVINGIADSWGMPRGNAWLGLSLFFIMGIGAGLYIKFHAPALALMVMALLMAGFVVLHILPSFMIYISIMFALGAWPTRPQGV